MLHIYKPIFLYLSHYSDMLINVYVVFDNKLFCRDVVFASVTSPSGEDIHRVRLFSSITLAIIKDYSSTLLKISALLNIIYERN